MEAEAEGSWVSCPGLCRLIHTQAALSWGLFPPGCLCLHPHPLRKEITFFFFLSLFFNRDEVAGFSVQKSQSHLPIRAIHYWNVAIHSLNNYE